MGYYDRWHIWVEDRYGDILTKDLVPQEFVFVRNLSGPCQIEFKVHPKEPSVQMPNGSGAIQFKPWGHLIHAVKEDLNGDEKVWGTGIFQPSDIDPDTGVMALRAKGFSCYADGLPWLENWNPIAVDPFEIAHRIWTHIQSYPMGNMGVTVYPTSSGTQMLPGFSFQNEEWIQDFFAIFIRESDRNDCGDYFTKLARDIPFDFYEESVWNPATRSVDKAIRLAYPYGGVDQLGIVFRFGENVSDSTQKAESETDWFSDVTIDGYYPGKVYSATVSNADPDRWRRVMSDKDLRVDSSERAAAWAHRLLTRNQAPKYFESIVVEPYHSNAPWGSYDVGDFIRYQGSMHWKGNINQKHKVMAIIWDEKKDTVELKLKAEGVFNYDPIDYIP